MNSSYGTSLAERLASGPGQWKEALLSLSRSLRVALPAIVESFDATKQTLSARVAITEVMRKGGVLTPETLPLLVDVPIVLPRAGGFTLTFPIQKGDECLIVFTDTCFDAWFQMGGQQGQMSQRRHSLSNGFALVGIWNQTRALPNYSTGSVQLRSDDNQTSIQVAPGTINLQANSVNVQASQVQVRSYNTCTVQVDGACTVQGSTVSVTASSQVNISGNGHTSIEGKDWLTHKHSGVASGGSQSGPVA